MRGVAFSVFVLLLAGSRAAAQAELTGDFIRYFGVGARGTFVNADNHSMQYTESGLPPYTCDAFSPGYSLESFTVTGRSSPFGRMFDWIVSTRGGNAFTTTSGPTIEGRSIRWSGRAEEGSVALSISQTVTYEPSDRIATVEVVVENAGTVDIPELFYARNADPDFARCSIGETFDTDNRTQRLPPDWSSGIVTASAADVTLGIGTLHPGARFHVAMGELLDAAWQWDHATPASGIADRAIAIIFREEMLRAGASTTFTFYYVWGTTVDDVLARFDAAVVCPTDGLECFLPREPGLCHAGSCCTGCVDGAVCQPGIEIAACGAGGLACVDCDDADPCTIDRCDAGTCAHDAAADGSSCDDGSACTTDERCVGGTCTAVARTCDDGDPCTSDRCDDRDGHCLNERTGCAAGGACIAFGEMNPDDACEVCDPSRSGGWTPVADGAACGAPSCVAGIFTPSARCAEGACVPAETTACDCANPSACVGLDAGATLDGGTVTEATGCGCSAADSPDAAQLWIAMAVLAAFRRKRRRWIGW